MAVDKSLLELSSFLNHRQVHLMMFAWVECLGRNMPSVDRKQAITQFIDHYNLDIDPKSAYEQISHMNDRFRSSLSNSIRK